MPRKPVSSGLQLITAPRTLTTFVFGGVAIGVLGNAVYQLLTNWLSARNSALLGIIIGAVVVLASALMVLNHLANRFRPSLPGTRERQPRPHRGLICLTSKEPTLRKALEWHNELLRWCWLVCSEESWPLASRLKAELAEQGKIVELVLVKNVLDAVECRNAIDRIYSTLPDGLAESDVILDFTGMTAIASVGAVLACMNGQRPIQYTPGIFDSHLQILRPREPIEIVLDWQSLSRSPATRIDHSKNSQTNTAVD